MTIYRKIRICISTHQKYSHTLNHNIFSYDIILSDSEPFSLNREFHWWSRAQEESKFTRWPGLLFPWDKVKVLWRARVCFSHLRLDIATSARYLLSRGVFVLRLFKKSSLKKSRNRNKSTPTFPKSIDEVKLPARENLPHYYLAETWGGRVGKTR